jgi:hypothetical protein
VWLKPLRRVAAVVVLGQRKLCALLTRDPKVSITAPTPITPITATTASATAGSGVRTLIAADTLPFMGVATPVSRPVGTGASAFVVVRTGRTEDASRLTRPGSMPGTARSSALAESRPRQALDEADLVR